MKKLHILLYKAFVGPFFLTLIISNFLLLMIWVWKWLEDIIGKGLDVSIILELVGYAALNQIPYSLPLAMLLSSIMAFGKIGETVELTAIKSSGVSLWRAMFPLTMVAVALSVFAFFFSNNMLPHSNARLKMLLRDITTQKPELTIPEGVFYKGLGNYTMRVGKKYKDKTLKDVLIFDNSRENSNAFLTSDSGRMELANNGDLLVLTLINGTAYKEEQEKVIPGKNKRFPLVRNKFETNQIVIDLSDFKFEQSEGNLYKGDSKMRNLSELNESVDSIQQSISKRQDQLAEDLNRTFFFRPDSSFQIDTLSAFEFKEAIMIDNFDSSSHRNILRFAVDRAKNTLNYISSADVIIKNQSGLLLKHKIEWHKKFTLSFACLLMFFIGAPFGAIVRRGGLGLPVVIAAILFIVFHIITIIGEKMVKKDEIDSFLGMWISSLVLTPLGLFLTFKATRDSELFNMSVYKNFFSKFFNLFKGSKK